MNERYSRLFSLQENQYTPGAPVMIAAGALLKDNQFGGIIAQLKLKNIGSKAILAAMVRLSLFDISGRPAGEVNHQYMDLHALRNTEFGQKNAIPLEDGTVRSFAAVVTSVVFADNTVWNGGDTPWESIPSPVTLQNTYQDNELVRQYQIAHGSSCKYYPSRHSDLWYCTCGILNPESSDECCQCGRSFARLTSLSVSELTNARDARLEAQRMADIEARKQAELRKAAAAKKVKKLSVILIPILILLLIGSLALSHYTGYQNAQNLAAQGFYTEARAALNLPAFLNLHDGEFLAYLSAGEALNAGDYQAAREHLKPLAEANYRNAAALMPETDYQEAMALRHNQEYEQAAALFAALAGQGYRNSGELQIQCLLDYAQQLTAQDDFTGAVAVYRELQELGCKDADSLLAKTAFSYLESHYTNYSHLKSVQKALSILEEAAKGSYTNAKQLLRNSRQLIYDHAVSLFESGKTVSSKEYFTMVKSFSRSADYLLLCKASSIEIPLDDLWEIRDLDAAMDLILSHDYLQEFLDGTWRTKDNRYYLTMEADGEISYTLPWIDYGDYYRIEEGKFLLYFDSSRGTTKGLFRITIKSWDQITVYCYKDGSTHTLYRE